MTVTLDRPPALARRHLFVQWCREQRSKLARRWRDPTARRDMIVVIVLVLASLSIDLILRGAGT
jgi:hypothetical protein